MLYWFPKTKGLNISQPKTEFYVIPPDVLKKLKNENMENLNMKEVKKVAGKIGYPLFLRTDMASGKHYWKKSCYVDKERKLKSHIFEVISFNLCADIFGLPFKALVFREFIPMKNLFTAFIGEMPVNPEIRFFVNEGEVMCWHWYWVEEAIEIDALGTSVPNWKEIIEKEKKEISGNEIMWLNIDAKKVAEVLKGDGYWSVDFCKAKDGRWILIDLAEGFKSWHPECKLKLTI